MPGGEGSSGTGGSLPVGHGRREAPCADRLQRLLLEPPQRRGAVGHLRGLDLTFHGNDQVEENLRLHLFQESHIGVPLWARLYPHHLGNVALADHGDSLGKEAGLELLGMPIQLAVILDGGRGRRGRHDDAKADYSAADEETDCYRTEL